MWDFLLWLYLINATLLLIHEIDSAYWKEWELFRLPGGITGFLIIHLPLVFLVLWGLVLLTRHSMTGVFFSLFLAGGGLFAYLVHSYFLRRGQPQFNTVLSRLILRATLAVSAVQAAVSIFGLLAL